jgi:hypothetical protein
MPTFHRIFGCKIDFYFNDHQPPHFHVHYAEHEALIEINGLTILRGNLPPKRMKEILKWAEENREELQEIWNNTRIK